MTHATGEIPILNHVLPDGTPIVLRPVLPSDRSRLNAGFERLSERTRFQRFFRGIGRLSEQDVTYLTRVDQVDHVAWAALDPTVPGEPGLGLGRFVRDPDAPEVAEAAFVVVDAYHRRGIGTALLAVLLARAEEVGVRTLRAVVRPDNDPMVLWMRTLGAAESRDDGLVYEFALPVGRLISKTAAARALDRLRRAFRGQLRRARRRTGLGILRPRGSQRGPR